jgi:hypothetical protein
MWMMLLHLDAGQASYGSCKHQQPVVNDAASSESLAGRSAVRQIQDRLSVAADDPATETLAT